LIVGVRVALARIGIDKERLEVGVEAERGQIGNAGLTAGRPAITNGARFARRHSRTAASVRKPRFVLSGALRTGRRKGAEEGIVRRAGVGRPNQFRGISNIGSVGTDGAWLGNTRTSADNRNVEPRFERGQVRLALSRGGGEISRGLDLVAKVGIGHPEGIGCSSIRAHVALIVDRSRASTESGVVAGLKARASARIEPRKQGNNLIANISVLGRNHWSRSILAERAGLRGHRRRRESSKQKETEH
jgi:hypothetical protein